MRDQITEVLEGNLAAGISSSGVADAVMKFASASGAPEYSDELLEAFKSECGLKSDATAEKYLRAALAVI